jgi:hypothetical protein
MIANVYEQFHERIVNLGRCKNDMTTTTTNNTKHWKQEQTRKNSKWKYIEAYIKAKWKWKESCERQFAVRKPNRGNNVVFYVRSLIWLSFLLVFEEFCIISLPIRQAKTKVFLPPRACVLNYPPENEQMRRLFVLNKKINFPGQMK